MFGSGFIEQTYFFKDEGQSVHRTDLVILIKNYVYNTNFPINPRTHYKFSRSLQDFLFLLIKQTDRYIFIFQEALPILKHSNYLLCLEI